MRDFEKALKEIKQDGDKRLELCVNDCVGCSAVISGGKEVAEITDYYKRNDYYVIEFGNSVQVFFDYWRVRSI